MMYSSRSVYYFYLFFINFFLNGVRGLKLTEFLVPDHAELGSSVTLTCHFDVGSGTLNSVKWYKGEHEFFRFSPTSTDMLVDFPADGVTLDLKASDKNKVTLKDLTFNSSGQYRCEVSSDLPDFQIEFDSKNMSIIAYPEWGPVITDVAPQYSIGQTVTANCSVAPSYPSPTLSWEINGKSVDGWDVVEVLIPGPGNLSSRRSTLQFQAASHHFQGSNQVITLRCRVNLGKITSSSLETTFTTLLAQSPGSLESALQRYRNEGSTFSLSRNLYISTFLIITAIKYCI